MQSKYEIERQKSRENSRKIIHFCLIGMFILFVISVFDSNTKEVRGVQLEARSKQAVKMMRDNKKNLKYQVYEK